MNATEMLLSEAEVVREYTPQGDKGIHGVTFDGKLVWFARDDELLAFDPQGERVVSQYSVPNANAGTAFDGKHLYQLAKGEILVIEPADGTIVRRLPAPGKGEDTGMAWADGYLWVGQMYNGKIHKVNAATGEIVKTLTSDRFVTGVSFVDGQLWHGAMGEACAPGHASTGEKACELRHIAADGTVHESVSVPVPRLAGMERTKANEFWCAGEKGKLRLIRRKAS